MASRGFLSRILLSGSDIYKLADIDKKLTETLRDMQLSLQLETIQLQRESYDAITLGIQHITGRVASMGGAEVCCMALDRYEQGCGSIS